jgi:predicted DNA-binding ArsR family transcriptional regulator
MTAEAAVLQCLQQTVVTQYFQLLLRRAVVVVDRGSQVRHLQWIMEELAAEPEHQVVVDQTQVTVSIVVSVTMVAEALMVKDIPEVQVLDSMQTLKIHTPVVAVVVLEVLEQALLTVVSVIAHHLEVIRFQAAPAVQQIF